MKNFFNFKVTAVLLVLWTITILIEDALSSSYWDVRESCQGQCPV